ncbi:hypothetical protein EB796_000042 [Bugula neritina]|uniref:Uncharacterized protein n=1 Tax=Bugula neritina TaxID=10212 RepID=A0A7J7KU39_BUGNE|nr:hypothetical protein EB796_000042 [Bugula neritina]
MASKKKPPAPARSTSIDEQFDAFLKASIGSDSDTSLSKYVLPKPRKEKPWWQSSVDTSEDFEGNHDSSNGGFGTQSKSFIKKKKAVIPPITSKAGETEVKQKSAVLGSNATNDKETPSAKPLEVVNEEKKELSVPFSAPESKAEPLKRSSKLFTETEEFRESQLSFVVVCCRLVSILCGSQLSFGKYIV